MASFGKVIGGHYVNATIDTNWKGELALTGQGFKRTPNLTAENVATWEEVPVETRGGKAAAVGKIGQAVARAALPGSVGKAASAAVGSTVESMKGSSRDVRVGWADGKQSLISLPDNLFQHLATLLGDRRVGGDVPITSASPPTEAPSGIVGQIAKFAAPTLGGLSAQQPDVMEQLAKLGALRDQGVLTEEEFAAKKAELLSRL
jgi:hypothetical protein